MHSSTTDGHSIRFLNIVDEYTRLCLSIKVCRSIPSEDAIDTLAALFTMHGVPKRVRCDNGPEFISTAIKSWLEALGVDVLYIEPGSPWQNGLCESFNGKLRDEYLHQAELLSVADARVQARAWREDYNGHWPHSSLGYLTPTEFALRCAVTCFLNDPFIPPWYSKWGHSTLSDALRTRGLLCLTEGSNSSTSKPRIDHLCIRRSMVEPTAKPAVESWPVPFIRGRPISDRAGVNIHLNSPPNER
ncbi:Integrase core domain protein [Aureliella helgolandensis]|uniref:Integrase core domain protein n=1 Tax=Aureliella helgolandensis TaxID=2527968 RepID=A0A518G9K9_9BACT|nr:Integrase core domain protein [Aureliella helgolandensis]